MRKILAATALYSTLVLLSGPGFAGDYLQSAPQQAPAPAKPAAAAKPAQPAGANVAQQQGAANPQPGQDAAAQKPDLTENSGEWILQCWKQPVKTCQLLQRRIEAKSKQQLILAAIAFRADGTRRLTMITPLGFKSTPTLAVFADKAPFVELPVKSCLPAGCLQIGDLSAQLVAKLEGATEMSIVLQGLNGQNFNLSIPTKGLKEGFARISQYMKS